MREQRLQLLSGLLLPGGCDLRTREHADRHDHEEKDEREIARRRDDGAGPEIGELALDALGDVGGRDALGDRAEDERERRHGADPGDQGPALATQRLSGWQFVERFGSALVDAGMPRMPALVFVALLASDSGRLTADELMEQLRVSRAAV